MWVHRQAYFGQGMRLVAILLLSLACATDGTAPWMQTHDPPESRADRLLARMSLEDKLQLLRGGIGPYVGNVVVHNQDLSIPPLRLNDGPQGFRGPRGTSTQWPCGLAMAATWDRELVWEWGAAMGREFAGKGSNVQLGPGLCLARVPTNGRNFEYLSGEDPYLGAELVRPAVQGIQSCGIIANAKHYLMNNQETDRMEVILTHGLCDRCG